MKYERVTCKGGPPYYRTSTNDFSVIILKEPYKDYYEEEFTLSIKINKTNTYIREKEFVLFKTAKKRAEEILTLFGVPL